MRLKIPLPNSVFRIGLLLMIIKVFLSLSNMMELPYTADMILSVVASLFLVISIFQKRFPMKTLLLFGLIIIIGFITSVRTGNMMMFIAILTCIAVCGEDLEETVRFLLNAESLLLLLVVVISFIMHVMGYSMLIRVSKQMLYGFGFSHPNVFACVLTNVFAMYLWLHFDTVRPINLAAIMLSSIVTFLITDSRTGLLVTLFLIAIIALCRNQEKAHRILKYSAMWALPVLALGFYLICKVFSSGNVLAQLVDMGLSGRIRFSAYSLERFGIAFFGQNLSNVKVKWDEFWQLSGITFDNIYTYLMVTQTVWLAVIAYLFYRVAKQGGAKQYIFIIAWALYGIAEIHVINPFLFFPLLMTTCLFNREEEEEPDEENVEGAE